MFAVIAFFWRQWKRTYFVSADAFKRFVVRAIWATALTAVIGYPIIHVIEHHQRSQMLEACGEFDGCALQLWQGRCRGAILAAGS